MSRCGCIRAMTSAEQRAAEATERQLRDHDRKHGTHKLRDHNDEQMRLFRATQARCRKQHGFWSW